MLLSPYRVLDLTSTHGMLCAQILGDLGADVIQVEPPGGALGRRTGPFLAGLEDPEHSVSWWGTPAGNAVSNWISMRSATPSWNSSNARTF